MNPIQPRLDRLSSSHCDAVINAPGIGIFFLKINKSAVFKIFESVMSNRHLRTDTKCLCGSSEETAENCLLHCPNYKNIRASTIFTLRNNQTDLRTLLYGNLKLRFSENEHIFIAVQNSRHLNDSKLKFWCF